MQAHTIDLRSWQTPELLVEAATSGAVAPDASVIIWNPCDGHHLHRLQEYPPARILADAVEGFGTHWCAMPAGPDEAPEDWRALDTLEEAYGETIPYGSTILLWSPSGAHRMSWLLYDRPWRIAEDGRRGLYTGWRLPPARPAE